MRRSSAILGSAVFLVLAPGTVAGYIPWLLSRWHFGTPFFGFAWLRILGVLLIAAALPVLLDSFARFAVQGVGTPAPPLPTQHLVVTGFFRYVRNPMYIAVASVIFGQGLLFGSRSVLRYGVVVWVAFFLFVVLYEEPALLRTFGAEYRAYRAHVPRWIPRLRPWTPSQAPPTVS